MNDVTYIWYNSILIFTEWIFYVSQTTFDAFHYHKLVIEIAHYFVVYFSVCFQASKIDELYAALDRKSSDVYVQRSQHLYVTSPQRRKLATWSMSDLEVLALADPTLHGRDNVVKHLRDIDTARSLQ